MNMLNKIYLAIKAWIILQLTNLKNWWLSLFSKTPDKNISTPSDAVKLDSTKEEYFNEIENEYRELQSIEDYLRENEQQLPDTILADPPLAEEMPSIASPLEENTLSVTPPPNGGMVSVPPPPNGGMISVPPPPNGGMISVPPPPNGGMISVPPPPATSLNIGQHGAVSTSINRGVAVSPTFNTAGENNASSFESEVANMSLPPEPIIPLYDGKYDDLFSTVETETSIPSTVVNEEIWDVLKERLPQGYSIPAPTSMMLYKRKY